MISREVGTYSNNSMTYNSLTDDATMLNYMALYVSIINDVPCVSALSQLGISPKVEETKKAIRKSRGKQEVSNTELKVYNLTNIETGDTYNELTAKEISNICGIGMSAVSVYEKKKSTYKKKWRFEVAGIKDFRQRYVVENIKTGEIVEVNGQQELIKMFGISQSRISICINNGRLIGKTYKITKKQ